MLRSMPLDVTKQTCSDDICRYIASASAPRTKMLCSDHETARLFYRQTVLLSKSSDISIPHRLVTVEALALLVPACS